MTEAFNALYEELKARVIHDTISELQKKYEGDVWRDTRSFTSDEVIRIKLRIESDILNELTGDIDYLFDQETDDTFTEIQETMEKDGFVIEEEEEEE